MKQSEQKEKIRSIRNNLHSLNNQGFKVNSLLDLTNFVEQYNHRFRNYQLKLYVSFFFVAIIFAAFLIMLTFPLALDFGGEFVTSVNTPTATVIAGVPLNWLNISYQKVNNAYLINDISIDSWANASVDLIIYMLGLFGLLIVVNKSILYLKKSY